MKHPLLLILALFSTVTAFGGASLDSKKNVIPEEKDHWKFMLASPGWMAGAEGTVGIDGVNSKIDLGFRDIFNKIDMVWAMRAEASKGRFGVMGELFYVSVSDSLGADGSLHKVDVRVDEYLADFSIRWRLIEGERGFVDAIVGARYTNLYQHLHLQGDDAGIDEASSEFVDSVSDIIRDRLNDVLSDHDFRNALTTTLDDRLVTGLDSRLGPNPRRRALAIGPLGARHPLRVALLVDEMIREEEAQLRAEIDALRLRGAARAAEVNQRVAAAKSRLEKSIAKVLEKNLNRTFSRVDDWLDPYIGIRARYNFTSAIYVIGRGDIGGFGIGSDLMWQLEAALGIQITRSIFAELGYRALSFDYDKGGLTYDIISHGAQVTLGTIF